MKLLMNTNENLMRITRRRWNHWNVEEEKEEIEGRKSEI